MYWIYTLLYLSVMPFFIPIHFLKRPSGLRSRWLRERFGFVRNNSHDEKNTIWLHAVSVGEAIAARPLIKKLYSDAHVVVSTVTDTGQKVVKDFITDNEGLIYMPFDFPSSVRRAMKRLRPALIVIMETEIWPSLLRVAKEMKIPVILVNGRISDNSLKGYRRIKFFMRPLLEMIDTFCMQTEQDADRIKLIGAPEERVLVTGNLKFDAMPPGDIPVWCQALGGPVVVAGSTHEGEEELVINAYRYVKKSFPSIKLIVAPRHPKRFEDVEEILRKMNLYYGKKSDNTFQERDVILLDTIGELSSVYGCADVCIIGGSFVPKGGQNLFEPAFWGKPIICGPHMENFPLASDFFIKGAALEVSPDSISSALMNILSDEALSERMGSTARDLYFNNQGAVLKTLNVMDKVQRFEI